MLAQAVHSADTQLLEKCLLVRSSSVIVGSVRRLPPAHVVPLMDALLVRLQARPSRAEALVEWIRAVLICHSAHLVSVKKKTPSLPLYILIPPLFRCPTS